MKGGLTIGLLPSRRLQNLTRRRQRSRENGDDDDDDDVENDEDNDGKGRYVSIYPISRCL